MNQGSILTVDDTTDFWIHAYLGADPDRLETCLKRAYLDFNRTLHHISVLPDNSLLAGNARALLKEAFEALRSDRPVGNVGAFDEWHCKTCHALVELYKGKGYPDFHIGQAQKWINMTFKYALMLGHRLPDFGDIYNLCHVPIDNIALEALSRFNPPHLDVRWSRIDD